MFVGGNGVVSATFNYADPKDDDGNNVRPADFAAIIGGNTVLLNTTTSEVDVFKTIYQHGGHTNSQVLCLNNASLIANTGAGETRFYSTNIGPQQTGDVIGFYGNLQTDSSTAGNAYNFYAEGTAP